MDEDVDVDVDVYVGVDVDVGGSTNTTGVGAALRTVSLSDIDRLCTRCCCVDVRALPPCISASTDPSSCCLYRC